MDILKNRNIEDVLTLINELEGERREYLQEYFANAPMFILQSFKLVDYPKNYVFIREKAEVDMVYILVEGVVRAVDYRIFGIAYNYMWFYPIQVFGAMEILIDCARYKTTLETVIPCKILTISKSKFHKWMKMDINALLIQTNAMVSYLLEQARKERLFLFTQGVERVFLLFKGLYERSAKNKVCIITLKRQELSDLSGLSVKTINRAVKKLEDEGYISREGNKILIDESQYNKINDYISDKIDQ